MINFLIFNTAIFSNAVGRWSDRSKGIQPKNSFEQSIDEHYHDDFMREIYPNMMFVE